MNKDKKLGFTRYKLTMVALVLFGIVALIVFGADAYMLCTGLILSWSNASQMILVALVSFFSGLWAAHSEAKKQEDA